MCVYVWVSVHVQFCGAKYLWYVCQMSQKVQNVEMVSVSVCVHVSVCICMCVWCAKCEISTFGMYAKWSKKCKMYKWYLYLCVHVSVYIFISVCVWCVYHL